MRKSAAGSSGVCSARTLSWPPTSHTVNEMFLYSTVSTLKPGWLVGGGVSHGTSSRWRTSSFTSRRFERVLATRQIYAPDLERLVLLDPLINPKKTLTDGGNSGDDLPELELVQNGGFTRGIETNLWMRKGTGFQRSRATTDDSKFLPSAEFDAGNKHQRTIRMRISFLEKSLLKSFVNVSPMVETAGDDCSRLAPMCLARGQSWRSENQKTEPSAAPFEPQTTVQDFVCFFDKLLNHAFCLINKCHYFTQSPPLASALTVSASLTNCCFVSSSLANAAHAS